MTLTWDACWSMKQTLASFPLLPLMVGMLRSIVQLSILAGTEAQHLAPQENERQRVTHQRHGRCFCGSTRWAEADGGSALSPKHRVRAQWRRWTEMLVDTLLRKQAGRRETESPRNWSMNSSVKANKKNDLSIYLSIVRKTSPKFSDDFNKSNA